MNHKILLSIFLLTFSFLVCANGVFATELNTTEPICEEQLELCVNEYNLLLEDFQEGVNCGNAFNLVKDMNGMLTEERDNCLKEIGGTKIYENGFYFLFGLLVIVALSIIISGVRKNKINTK